MDIGALDLGSNSFHMLVARVGSGVITKLGSQKRTLRLGAHVQASGFIPKVAFDEALGAVQQLVGYARAFSDARSVIVGTSALRDATNGAEFGRAVLETTGVPLEIVSGELEARLVYEGARSGLHGLPPRVGVVDIGGGSVEIAYGENAVCTPVATLPLGFLRFGRSLGLGGELDVRSGAMRVQAEGQGALAEARRLAPDTWIFCGGTARAFHSVAVRIAGVRQAERTLSARMVREVAAFLSAADAELLIAQGVDSARVNTIGAGAVVLAALVEALDVRAIAISPGGLREGIALREAGAFGIETKRRSAARHAPVFAFQ